MLIEKLEHLASTDPLTSINNRRNFFELLESEIVSIGLTDLSEKDTSYKDLVNRADVALYKAKRAGRNRVIQYEQV